MPAIRAIDIELDIEQVENLRGIRGNTRLRPRIKALLPEILDEVKNRQLIQAAISYEVTDINRVIPGTIELQAGYTLESPLLSQRLKNASRLAAGVITIGSPIGDTISQWFTDGRSLQATLLEEIANALLFRVSDLFQETMAEQATALGLQASGPLSPGDEGFAFDQQSLIMGLARSETVGITVSATGFMLPVHSTSVVVGFGMDLPRWTQADNCQVCHAREKCAHRHDPAAVEECVLQ